MVTTTPEDDGEFDNGFDMGNEKEADATLASASCEPGKSYGLFTYDGRLHWHIPKLFQFPQDLNLTTGWGLWITGMPSKLIHPFRLFKKESLPPHIRSQFLLHWKPIFGLMECNPALNKESIGSPNPTAEAITESLEKCQAYLRTDRLSYVFDNPKKNSDSWALSTWSRHCQPSVILKHGSKRDKSFFPKESFSQHKTSRAVLACASANEKATWFSESARYKER